MNYINEDINDITIQELTESQLESVAGGTLGEAVKRGVDKAIYDCVWWPTTRC